MTVTLGSASGLAVVAILAAKAGPAHPGSGTREVVVPEAGIRLRVPAEWKEASRQATTPNRTATPPFPAGGTITLQNRDAQIVVAYFVYDPKLQSAQRARYSPLKLAKSAHLPLTRPVSLRGASETEFEVNRAARGQTVRVHGMFFSKGRVDCEITLAVHANAKTLSTQARRLQPAIAFIRKTFTIGAPVKSGKPARRRMRVGRLPRMHARGQRTPVIPDGSHYERGSASAFRNPAGTLPHGSDSVAGWLQPWAERSLLDPGLETEYLTRHGPFPV